MLSMKSEQSFSTVSARIGPSWAMADEMSLISSSCIMANSRVQCSSPSAIIRMAAFCGPLMLRRSSGRAGSAMVLRHPAAHDRQGFLRMFLHQVGQLAQRGRAHLPFDHREVDHAFVLQKARDSGG